MREVIGAYKNGNYHVIILSDGTMIRNCNEKEMIPDFPDSADVKLTNKCDRGCAFCFTPDTRVRTSVSYKNIQDLHVGDIVESFDAINNVLCESKVLDKFKRYYSGDIVCIYLDSGKVIRCTPNHKILTKNRGWIDASKLNDGDDIYDC